MHRCLSQRGIPEDVIRIVSAFIESPHHHDDYVWMMNREVFDSWVSYNRNYVFDICRDRGLVGWVRQAANLVRFEAAAVLYSRLRHHLRDLSPCTRRRSVATEVVLVGAFGRRAVAEIWRLLQEGDRRRRDRWRRSDQ